MICLYIYIYLLPIEVFVFFIVVFKMLIFYCIVCAAMTKGIIC